jgi:hypothetical protein
LLPGIVGTGGLAKFPVLHHTGNPTVTPVRPQLIRSGIAPIGGRGRNRLQFEW